MKFRPSNGFSLIELMVVVAIVGILAMIAVPSYSSHVIKASRAAAQTELLQLASLQEKIYLNSNAYTASVTLAYNGRIDTDATTPGGLGITTGQTSDGKYNLSVTTSAAPSQIYTIAAQPVFGGKQAGNGCLTIQENGLRLWYQNSDNCGGTGTAW